MAFTKFLGASGRASAPWLLLLATTTAIAADDFWTLLERGEMNGKPEVAYARFIETFETREHTVFCHVGPLVCGDAMERGGGSAEQLAEIQETIAMMAAQMPMVDRVLRSSSVEGKQATLRYSAHDAKGNPLEGRVLMEMRSDTSGKYWRIVEQEWK